MLLKIFGSSHCRQLLSSLLIFVIVFAPLHDVRAQNPSPESVFSEQTAVNPLMDSISDSILQEAGIQRTDLRSFQHKYSGRDLQGKLQNIVVDYVGGQLTLEQTYTVLSSLRPEINSALDENSKAKFTVNIVRDGITQQEELEYKKMIDSLDLLNPEYKVHSVTENTRLKMSELGKFFSTRYQTRNTKRWALLRFIVNGTVVGISIWNSYEYLPAAIGVGVGIGAASGMIQLYIEALSQFLINTKTKAGEFARWWATEVVVSAMIPLILYYGFNISPEYWSLMALQVVLLASVATPAQGTWDIFLSNKKEIKITETAVGTKTMPGENALVFRKAELLGLDVFKLDADVLREQVRPREYKIRENITKSFVGVSMAWAFLAAVGLAGENFFPGHVNLGIFDVALSSVVSYGGFALMGASAVLFSKSWNKQRLKTQNPEWTKQQVSQALKRMRTEFWSYLFLDKFYVQQIKIAHPDWSIERIKEEVKRLETDSKAHDRLNQELLESAAPAQGDLFRDHRTFSCKGYFQ